MKHTFATAGAALFLFCTAPGYAQETTAPASQASPGMMGGMKMEDMMSQCRTHCQNMSSSMDNLANTIEEARASNDPAKMRDALEKAQKALTEMKEKMSSCRSMMDMMGKMHSGGGMGMMSGAGEGAKE